MRQYTSTSGTSRTSVPAINFLSRSGSTGTICRVVRENCLSRGYRLSWDLADGLMGALLLTLIISSMAKIKQTQGTDDEVSSWLEISPKIFDQSCVNLFSGVIPYQERLLALAPKVVVSLDHQDEILLARDRDRLTILFPLSLNRKAVMKNHNLIDRLVSSRMQRWRIT